MKTILVTGGLGFIGSHFMELALSKGYNVINIDKITYASRPHRPIDDSNRYQFIRQDISTIEYIPHSDYIVHFAAESHVDRSIANSDPFIQSNIQGTYNLLELLKNKKIENMQYGWEYKYPTLVYIGTDEVFGDTEKGFFKEDDQFNPSNPYSASKASAEMLIKAWGRTYGIPYRITRTTNNYGEHQHEEKLIPQCINRLIKGEKIPIHGSGNYVRNWIYVKDNCEAIMKVMEDGKDGEAYHISSDEEYSVNQIVQMITGKFNRFFTDSVEYIPNRSGQDLRYALDNSKIQRELSWTQKHKMEDVLSQIIESYQ
jgi:dTDP-glucose 4,6-dehydratase